MTTVQKSNRIVSLRAENIKRIKAVEVIFDENRNLVVQIIIEDGMVKVGQS